MLVRVELAAHVISVWRTGVTFVENTGDEGMMTFPTVSAAAQAASKLLRGLRDRPPKMTPLESIRLGQPTC